MQKDVIRGVRRRPMRLWAPACAAALVLSGCWWRPYTPEQIQTKGLHIQFASGFAPDAAARCIERNARGINNRYVSNLREMDSGIELTLRIGRWADTAAAVAVIVPRADTGMGAGSSVTLSITPRNISPRSLAMALRGKC